MYLTAGSIGNHYEIEQLELEGTILRRLQALGLTVGTRIHVLNNKKGGSVIFMVRGTRLATGKKIADKIRIKEA
ncbi:MAG: FeoA family protein [Acetivibrio sp.]